MKIKSIQCKKCAAPLSLHGGGHRIRALTCEYCGAVMDVQKDYALLGQFKDQAQPICPLTLGSEGNIKDIPFIVIGMIEYRSSYGDRWTDLHLYSKTHGYAWLSYQLGHFTFTRRVRNLPSRDMATLSPRSTFRVRDEPYRFMETYQAEIIYVVGELTWVAKIGDTTILRDAIAPPYLFSMEETENEHEYHLTEYIDPDEIKDNFELSFDTHRSFIHPAQPFKAPIRKALSNASKITLALSLFLYLFISWFVVGHTVLSEKNKSLSSGMTVYPFVVKNPKHLMEIKFNNPKANQWKITEMTIFDEKNKVFSFGNKLSAKTDSSSSQTGVARFSVKQAGDYTLRINLSEKSPATISAKKQTQSTLRNSAIDIVIREGVVTDRYFKYLFFLSLLSFLIFYISRYYFEQKRWAMNN